jgi:4a-hydroxytetrahydrobiopterin dehydratase
MSDPSADSLASGRCVPCEGGVEKLTAEAIQSRLPLVPGWRLEAGDKIAKSFTFPDFVSLMAFVNAMAGLAESEGHHPDFSVHYSRLDVEIWTHAVGGLSENDFILAAKIDRLPA